MTKTEEALYAAWKEEYGLEAGHAYTKSTDADCQAAFMAGRVSQDRAIAELKSDIARLHQDQQHQGAGVMRPMRDWAPYVWGNFAETLPIVIVGPLAALVWFVTAIVRVVALLFVIPANAEWPNHRLNSWHEFFRFEIEGMG